MNHQVLITSISILLSTITTIQASYLLDGYPTAPHAWQIQQADNRLKSVKAKDRAVEGIPTIARHQTHANGGIAWRNHGGAIGRVFGTVPLAADGSFALELPSDRLFHLQVLDSDRRVMGNELIWQYVRPKEIKGCVGCHENPDDAPAISTFPLAQKMPPVKCFPYGDEMQYRAKMWFKGWAPDEREERMRTVNSINIIGRQ
jgi:hypothetical protein